MKMCLNVKILQSESTCSKRTEVLLVPESLISQLFVPKVKPVSSGTWLTTRSDQSEQTEDYKPPASFNNLRVFFPHLSEVEVTAGVFLRPQITKILDWTEFTKKEKLGPGLWWFRTPWTWLKLW